MLDFGNGVQSFVLAFSALFSIVNPIGAALVFSQVTADRSHAERVLLSRRIGLYAAAMMLGALWLGAYVLEFFGVSLAALRIAGGLVVAVRAWHLLMAPEAIEARKQEQAGEATGAADDAFFPLTMPFTTGPGTISVAVALGANRPAGGIGTILPFFAGVSAAAIAVAVTVWLAYSSADRLTGLLGEARARVVSRLAAFLMLCVGTQITLGGVIDVLRPLLAVR
jgi:multiple antibiotic resistance protein